MVKPEVVRKRLNKLDEYLSILRGLQRYSFEEFVDDPEHYGSAERFLHLAIETVVDLGNHVIAEMALGTVNCPQRLRQPWGVVGGDAINA